MDQSKASTFVNSLQHEKGLKDLSKVQALFSIYLEGMINDSECAARNSYNEMKIKHYMARMTKYLSVNTYNTKQTAKFCTGSHTLIPLKYPLWFGALAGTQKLKYN